jgi:hypothetical protein
MPNGSELATPEEVLKTCFDLEKEAAVLYRRFQAAAPDPELRALWATMAHEEEFHAGLIEELSNQARTRYVAPAVPRDVLRAIVERVAGIRREADLFDLNADRMLSITAALEFSEMDDLFDAVCRASRVPVDVGRASHLRPLVEAALQRRSVDGILRHLLAAMIRLRRHAGALAAPLEEDEDDDDRDAAAAAACDD